MMPVASGDLGTSKEGKAHVGRKTDLHLTVPTSPEATGVLGMANGASIYRSGRVKPTWFE